MKALVLDLETSPNLAHVWSLWNQNVSLVQLRESTRVISFAAKWYGKKGIEFHSDLGGHEAMVRRAHELLSEADAVIHYNGTSFDMPHLHREFLLAGLEPPAPYRNIDLLRTVRKQFRFPSNKLDYVAQALGVGHKVKHPGHELWVRCLAGEERAWRLMEKYNRGDVALTERVYKRLLPWITNHPDPSLYAEVPDGKERCNKCASTDLERRGYAFTDQSKFQQFRCRRCGGWKRSTKAVARVETKGIS